MFTSISKALPSPRLFTRWAVALTIVITVLGVAEANFNVTPLRLELTPTGKGSQMTLRVQNLKQEALAVDTYAVFRRVSDEGEEVREPADEDFLIFPPQTLLEPGKTQVFTVKYVGDGDIAQSRYYGVGFREVPAETPGQKEGASVNIAFSYLLATVVTPEGARPDVTVKQITPATEDGTVELLIENEGNAHAVLSRATWRLTGDGGQSKELSGQDDFSFLGFPLLEPGTSRRFVMPGDAYADIGKPQSIEIVLDE